MNISFPNYDKYHRCPGWSGPRFKSAKNPDKCSEGGSLAAYGGAYYNLDGTKKKYRNWRFNKCPKCQLIILPYNSCYIDPTYLFWRITKWVRGKYYYWYWRL